MAQSAYMASTASAGRTEVIVATSQSKESRGTANTQDIPGDDLLKMLQALLNKINEIPGVNAKIANIYHEGETYAAIILEGCEADDVGNIRFAD